MYPDVEEIQESSLFEPYLLATVSACESTREEKFEQILQRCVLNYMLNIGRSGDNVNHQKTYERTCSKNSGGYLDTLPGGCLHSKAINIDERCIHGF
jgi:hypothetical protein